MTDLAGIPADLVVQAVVVGEEPAWPPSAARQVIEFFQQSGTAVLGVELWVAQGEHPLVLLPWCSRYQVEFTGDWQGFVDENARLALMDLAVAEASNEVPQEVLVNLTWINQEEWGNLHSEKRMIMQHWSVFGTNCSPPEPNQVVEAVRAAGFHAVRLAELNAYPGSSISFALHYDPQRAPLFVELEWLIREEWDLNTSTWELAEERISDPATLQSIRCYADVRHYGNADPAAVKAAVDFLQVGCAGLGVFPWQMHGPRSTISSMIHGCRQAGANFRP